MATKGYIFQGDEKTVIDIDIDMNVVVEKEENEWMRKKIISDLKFQNWLNFFVGEKWRIVSCLTKLLTDDEI